MRHKDNIVVAEHAEGRIQPVTYEAVTFAKKVADATGGKVSVAVMGRPVRPFAEEIAAETGCDVYAMDSEAATVYNAEVYRSLLKKSFESITPRFVFIPHTATGWDYAPALAVDLSASGIAAVIGFREDSGPIFTRRICNGKILEDLRPLEDRPAVITLMPGVEKPHSRKAEKPGEVKIYEMEARAPRAKTLRYVEAPSASVNLQEAEVIVAAGRGVGDPEHLDAIGELAKLFERGALGASRPLCDMRWLPFDCQVGMTGQDVSPKLYIACGISGAVQHTMGMRNSGLIIAVNMDKNALFHQTAHYCVAADLHKFIPALIEKIRELKSR